MSGYASLFAGEVLSAVGQQVGGLTPAEYGQAYGALFAAAATQPGAFPDPRDFNTGALAGIIASGRRGPCVRCGRPLAEHDLDIASWPWLRCPEGSTTGKTGRKAAILAGALWVGVPFLSLGTLSWLPPLVASMRHRGCGWGVAAAMLVVLALSLWTRPEVDIETRMALWLGATIFGATQVKPWLRREAVRARTRARRRDLQSKSS